MDEERPLYDELLDVVVYAPIGAAVRVANALPDLIREGRSRIEGTVQVASLMGRLLAGQVRRFVDAGAIERTREVSSSVTSDVREAVVRSENAGLAIEDYESLAASTIVTLLSSLSREDLENVRRYEQAHRQRRTVLGRIAQLTGDPRGAR
jgi:hypothetical protein